MSASSLSSASSVSSYNRLLLFSLLSLATHAHHLSLTYMATIQKRSFSCRCATQCLDHWQATLVVLIDRGDEGQQGRVPAQEIPMPLFWSVLDAPHRLFIDSEPLPKLILYIIHSKAITATLIIIAALVTALSLHQEFSSGR